MIGGVGFLALYNPSTGAVYDLTDALDSVLNTNDSLDNSMTNAVNSIVWTNDTWMLAGGAPVGFDGSENQTAWVASYDPQSGQFSDLTSQVIPSSILSESSMSGILSMACDDVGCALGGFAGSNPVLIWYNGSNTMDLSDAIPSGNMNYVQWVGVSDAVGASQSPPVHVTSAWAKNPASWHFLLVLRNFRSTFCITNPWRIVKTTFPSTYSITIIA